MYKYHLHPNINIYTVKFIDNEGTYLINK